jgi:DNA polymerase-3 subunit alpha/error-prone DNA polymerase
MFSHLQLRSAYSLLSGPCRIEDLVMRAAALGFTTLALTDLDNLYGVHAFIDAAREAGLRPIIGAELRVAGGSVLALVKDRRGFGNLCELVSAIHAKRRAAAERPELLEELTRLHGGLVYASYEPALLARLAGAADAGSDDAAMDLYAALSPRRLTALSAASRLGLPLLALGDAYLLEKADFEVHRLLRAIGEGASLGNLPAEALDSPDALLFGPEEAERLFSQWPEALAANEEVARACRFDGIFDGFAFPAALAAGAGAASEAAAGAASTAASTAASEAAAASRARLRELAYAGAEARYGEVGDAVVDRLEYELDIIDRKGFSDYFLVVAEIAGFTERTCGRGSGASSAVAYCLGITNVDPIRHHLWFERFLNESRPDPPDIDIDFAWDERDEVIKRAIERFGADRAARVANHLCFRPRSALRETARAFGLPGGEIAACERARFEDNRAEGLDSWRAKPVWGEVLALAARIEGLPRGLSMHCGGLVITPGPIRRYAPVETSAEGYPLLQWEKDGTEEAGLVKIDLLGNRSLAVIRDAVANIEEEGGDVSALRDPASFEALSLGDPETEEMLARGDSMGVFYIESPAMRQLQKKAGVGDYEHIVIHSSIIRPAANKFITEYVKRLHGAPWEPLHPRLEEVLKETYGIMVYQEDVSKAAMALADFSESDADALRKILAKKNKAKKLAEYKARFFEGCAGQGVGEEVATAVWQMMESFAGYSFCKPHSASYAVVSFQSAWLRRHHPAEFMAAVLSNQGGFYTPGAYVSEARRMAIPLAGPDVNLSVESYRASKGRLVIGLMAVAGLSKAAISALVAERAARGPFPGLEDFTRRVRLAQDEVLALAEAGAFDSIAEGRPRTETARFLLCAREAAKAAAHGGLFDAGGTGLPTGAKPPPATHTRAAQNAERAILAEYRVLGFLRDRHPLSLWKREAALPDRVLARDLGAHIGRVVLLVCIPVTRKEVLTSGGDDMCFVSLEDETAIIEAVLFPEAFDAYARFFFEVRPLVVEGKVEDDQGAISFEIRRVARLETGDARVLERPGARASLGPWH